jgi:hypothetical protein
MRLNLRFRAEVRTRQVQVAERVARVPALEVVLRAPEMKLLVLVHRSFFSLFFFLLMGDIFLGSRDQKNGPKNKKNGSAPRLL